MVLINDRVIELNRTKWAFLECVEIERGIFDGGLIFQGHLKNRRFSTLKVLLLSRSICATILWY